MCLIVFAYRYHPQLPLVVAANRDEFHSRPSRRAGFWNLETPHPGLLAGQDLSQGGTWLGISRGGRFAAVTNFRTPGSNTGTKSRGLLTREFLLGDLTAADYVASLRNSLNDYGPFNLLVGDSRGLYYLNGISGHGEELGSGVYGLSNGVLNSDWPKVCSGKAALKALLQQSATVTTDRLTSMMTSREPAPDPQLPETGLPLELERVLSSSFIANPQRNYGTRCTTALIVDQQDMVRFSEQCYGADSAITSRCYFHFPLLGNSRQVTRSVGGAFS